MDDSLQDTKRAELRCYTRSNIIYSLCSPFLDVLELEALVLVLALRKAQPYSNIIGKLLQEAVTIVAETVTTPQVLLIMSPHSIAYPLRQHRQVYQRPTLPSGCRWGKVLPSHVRTPCGGSFGKRFPYFRHVTWTCQKKNASITSSPTFGEKKKYFTDRLFDSFFFNE